MSCVLRAGGTDFDVEAFLQESALVPCAVLRRGEPRAPASNLHGRSRGRSGFNVDVSDAEFTDLEGQTRDALRFLRDTDGELRRLAAFPGVEEVELDFAVSRGEGFVASYRFAPELLARAGGLGITLTVSCYAEAEEAQPNAPSEAVSQQIIGSLRGGRGGRQQP